MAGANVAGRVEVAWSTGGIGSSTGAIGMVSGAIETAAFVCGSASDEFLRQSATLPITAPSKTSRIHIVDALCSGVDDGALRSGTVEGGPTCRICGAGCGVLDFVLCGGEEEGWGDVGWT